MKHVIITLARAFAALFTPRSLIRCANVRIATENATAVASSFTVQQPDGFFVPYGDYPHKNGLQKFDKDAATKMASHFNGLLQKLANAFAGPAVYIGHPDVPGRGTEFPDKKAYGRITGIEVRDDGALFTAKMNSEGAELVANASFAYYSPFWGCEKVQGGIRPVQLYSIGLTNTPNIDVPALANDAGGMCQCEKCGESFDYAAQNEATTGAVKCPKCGETVDSEGKAVTAAEDTCKPKTENTLITALITAGIVAENDEQPVMLEKIAKLIEVANEKTSAALVALNHQLAAANTAATDALAKATAANDTLTKTEADIAAANDALKAARTLAANSALDIAITTGRLTPADREAKLTALLAIENSTDFTASLTGIIAAPVVMKTENTHSASLGKEAKVITAANEEHEKSKQRLALVDRCKKKFPRLSGQALHDAAWNSARAEKPELFS